MVSRVSICLASLPPPQLCFRRACCMPRCLADGAERLGRHVGRRSALDRNAGAERPAVRARRDPGGATRQKRRARHRHQSSARRAADRRACSQAAGADASGVNGNVQLFFGGPVDPQAGFVLHSAEYHGDNSLDIDGRVALSSGVRTPARHRARQRAAAKPGRVRLCRLGARAARRRTAPRRLEHNSGGPGSGVRRRPGQGLERRDGAV